MPWLESTPSLWHAGNELDSFPHSTKDGFSVQSHAVGNECVTSHWSNLARCSWNVSNLLPHPCDAFFEQMFFIDNAQPLYGTTEVMAPKSNTSISTCFTLPGDSTLDSSESSSATPSLSLWDRSAAQTEYQSKICFHDLLCISPSCTSSPHLLYLMLLVCHIPRSHCSERDGQFTAARLNPNPNFLQDSLNETSNALLPNHGSKCWASYTLEVLPPGLFGMIPGHTVLVQTMPPNAVSPQHVFLS